MTHLSATRLRFSHNPHRDEAGLVKDQVYLINTREATEAEKKLSFGGTIALSFVEEPERGVIIYTPRQFWSYWSWVLPWYKRRLALCLNDSIILVAESLQDEARVTAACDRLRTWARGNGKSQRLNFRTDRILVAPCDMDAVVAQQIAQWDQV